MGEALCPYSVLDVAPLLQSKFAFVSGKCYISDTNINNYHDVCNFTRKLDLYTGSRHYCDCIIVGFITIFAISCEFEPRSGEAYPIQHYEIKFVSDLQQMVCFHWVLLFPPPIKLTTMI